MTVAFLLLTFTALVSTRFAINNPFLSDHECTQYELPFS